MDFIFDALVNGATLKILTIGDDFTRECLCLAVATSFPSLKVIAALNRLVGEFGAPEYLKSDNGSAFIAHILQAWLSGQGSRSHFIAPAPRGYPPWQNGFRESFPSRFRDEFLSLTLFVSVSEARVLCEAFRREYNAERPHQSLGYLTPSEFKEKWLQKQSDNAGD